MKSRGERLKQLRTTNNLSINDLSEYLGISQNGIENLENNVGKLNLTVLTKLSNMHSEVIVIQWMS